MRLSYWFEKGGFFDGCDCASQALRNCPGSAHEKWCPNTHPKRLRRMLEHVGISENDINLDGAPYFARSRDSYLLRWTNVKLQDIRNSPDSQAKTEIYRNLKAVFCKTCENRGKGVRFSARRLYCTLRAAVAGRGRIGKAVVFEPESSAKLKEGKFWSREDPTKLIGELVHSLADFDFLTRISFRPVTIRPFPLAFTSQRSSRRMLAEGISHRLKLHGQLFLGITRALFGAESLHIRVEISADSDSLSFSTKPTLCST